LHRWPDHLCLQGPAGDWLHATHGSLAGNRDGISHSTTDVALRERIPLDAALFVVAHTHKPLLRHYQGVDIVNVGSVGSPFDGNPRASYARIEYRRGRWHSDIVRFDYDREQTRRDFQQSGFLDQAGPLAGFIFAEWERAQLMMPRFLEQYLPRLRQGDISLEQAIERFLQTA
jgi:diadenosine tetraphosphatase ApaH/serine/threonine PP2A family protein phosphatase